MLDSLRRASELTVRGGDFYDSGREQTGPRTVLVDHSWELISIPSDEKQLIVAGRGRRRLAICRRLNLDPPKTTSAAPAARNRTISAVPGPPPSEPPVPNAACFQTRLWLLPTVARSCCLPLSRRVAWKVPPLLTERLLTVTHRDPCRRWIFSLPASGDLPQALRVLRSTRSVTKGKRKAVRDGFGRPSLK